MVSRKLAFVRAKSGCFLSTTTNLKKYIFNPDDIKTSKTSLRYSQRSGDQRAKFDVCTPSSFGGVKTDRIALYILACPFVTKYKIYKIAQDLPPEKSVLICKILSISSAF